MKRGYPTITAPISRTKKSRRRQHDNNVIAIVCAMSIFLCVSTAMMARSLLATTSLDDEGVVDVVVHDKDAGSTPPSSRDHLRRRSRGIGGSNNDHDNNDISPPEEDEDGDSSSMSSTPTSPPLLPGGIVIHTSLGDVSIRFAPEWSGISSIRYVVDVIRASSSSSSSTSTTTKCENCKFYRAEPGLLLQGIIAHPSSTTTSKPVLGPCPIDNYVPKSICPGHDPNCGCHGPVMTRGMVGWAGGGSGPDFFINTFATPVDWWENQHTVWGEIRDEESLRVVESAYDLPAHVSGMRMLDEEIEFMLELVQ